VPGVEDYGWVNVGGLAGHGYVCGYCGHNVGSNTGWSSIRMSGWRVYLCPLCGKPSFFENGPMSPGVPYGPQVAFLPNDIETLYEEARKCYGVNAYSSIVLTCRKILMHVAVEEGAPPNKNFVEYVDYLETNGYIPVKAKSWVDQIRQKGNQATHEIKLVSQGEAQEAISFTEMLLKNVYEFPARAATSGSSGTTAQPGTPAPTT